MGKSLALSIEIGLKDRATKGLQAIGGEVKKMAGGMGPVGSVLTAMVPEIGIPLQVLQIGFKAATSSVSFAGGVISKVFSGIGSVVSSVAHLGMAALDSLAEHVKAAGKWLAMLGLAAVAAMVMVAKTSLDAAMQVQVMNAQMLTAMRNTKAAAEMMAWAKKMAETAPFEVGDIVRGTTQLQLFGLEAKKWMPMIADMAAAMRTPLEQAVQAVALAMSGGRMMGLRQFGISPQKLVAAGAVKGPGGEVKRNTPEEAAKFAVALQKVMVDTFGGGTARLFDTLAGKMTSFKDAIFWLKAGIGEALLPAMKGFVALGADFIHWLNSMGVAERLGGFFAGIADKLLWFGKALAYTIAQVAGGKSLGAVVRDVIEQGFGKDVAKRVGSTVDGIINGVGGLWTALKGLFTQLTGGIASDPLKFILGLVNGITKGVLLLTNAVAWIGANFKSLGAWFKYLGDFFTYLVRLANYAVQWFYHQLPGIAEVCLVTFGAVSEELSWIREQFSMLVTSLKIMGHAVEGVFWSMVSAVTSAMQGIGTALLVMVTALTVLNPTLAPLLKETKDAYDTLKGWANKAGSEVQKANDRAFYDLQVGIHEDAKILAERAAMRAGVGKQGDWLRGFRDQVNTVPMPGQPIAPQQPQVQWQAWGAGGAGGNGGQTTNNYYIQGNGDAFLQDQFNRLMRGEQLEQRHARVAGG